MQLHLNLSGWLLVGLALLHIIFPRYFRWKTTTVSLEPVTREILYVHTLFIAVTVMLMGLLCLTSAELLLDTELGFRVCLGLAVFWTLRLFVQFFGYSSELWRGKAFETAVHIAFAGLWLYLSAVFWMAALRPGG
jgi:hypothetical protein